jgi:hypothetical protein
MMEAVSTSETLVNIYQTTWCYNPEDSHLPDHTLMLLMIIIFIPSSFLNTEYQHMQNNNVASCFVWMWNIVSYSQGRT